MPIKKRRGCPKRLGQDGKVKTPISITKSTIERRHSCSGRKSWLDRLLDLMKIGVGLANLIVGFLKH